MIARIQTANARFHDTPEGKKVDVHVKQDYASDVVEIDGIVSAKGDMTRLFHQSVYIVNDTLRIVISDLADPYHPDARPTFLHEHEIPF